MAARRRSKTGRYLATLAAFVLIGWAGTVSAQAQSSTYAEARYTVTLRGVSVADARIGFAEDGSSYRVAVDATVSGLATLVAQGSATASSSGTSGRDGLQSESFSLTTRTDSGSFTTSFEASSGNVTSSLVVPELAPDPNRVSVSRAHLRGINDAIAAFLVKAPLTRNVCNLDFAIYTGVERFDLRLKFSAEQRATSRRTGYQGPVMLCAARYVPISGHFTTSETTNYLADNQSILVWFAPMGETGFLLPYRLVIGTAYGDLSMVLTELNVN